MDNICASYFCDEPADGRLCTQCYWDEQACLNGECTCCIPEPPEYPTADVVYDMRGGATSDDEWYGGRPDYPDGW